MAPLVWLITGTTSGIGAALVKSVSSRGDLVIATGRNAEQRLASIRSDSVAVLDLDVTAPRDVVGAQVDKAIGIFGRVDVLINNAGAGAAPCPVEEAPDDLVAGIFDANLFGAWRVTQAVLPHMRARRWGRIGFVGSGMGWAPMPFLGVVSAAKAALGSTVEALEKEVGPLGIHAVCFELGGFPTSSRPRPPPGPGASGGDEPAWAPPVPRIGDYGPGFARQMEGLMGDVMARKPGDVAKLPEAVIDVIKGEGRARGRKWPVRVALGPDSEAIMTQKCKETLDMMEEWRDVSRMTVRDDWDGEVSPYLLKACSTKAE